MAYSPSNTPERSCGYKDKKKYSQRSGGKWGGEELLLMWAVNMCIWKTPIKQRSNDWLSEITNEECIHQGVPKSHMHTHTSLISPLPKMMLKSLRSFNRVFRISVMRFLCWLFTSCSCEKSVSKHIKSVWSINYPWPVKIDFKFKVPIKDPHQTVV